MKRFRPTLPRTDLLPGPDGLAQEDDRIVTALQGGLDVNVTLQSDVDWTVGDMVEIVDKDYKVVGVATVKVQFGNRKWTLGNLVRAA